MLTRQTLIGPWAGVPIAWNEYEEFEEKTYRADLERCCQAGVPGVYTCGTTGEFYAIEIDEFETISEVTIDECHLHNTPVIIGCTATSTRGAVRRAAIAAKLGADGIQVALPFWLELQNREVIPFFNAVADAAEGLPLSVYETARAKKCLTIEQHREIQASIPQYIMVKANAGTVGATPEGCRELSSFVNVFVGESQWSRLGQFGVIGACSAMVYWNPWVVFDAWQHLRNQDWDSLRSDGSKITHLHEFLIRAYADKNFMDSADDRNAARATGFLATSLRTRGPYGYATEGDTEVLRLWLQEHYPEMLEMRWNSNGKLRRPHFVVDRQSTAASQAKK